MFSQASPAHTTDARRRDEDRIVGVNGKHSGGRDASGRTLVAEAAEHPEDNATAIALIPGVTPVERLDKVLWWFR